jgi:hypothetical protein
MKVPFKAFDNSLFKESVVHISCHSQQIPLFKVVNTVLNEPHEKFAKV